MKKSLLRRAAIAVLAAVMVFTPIEQSPPDGRLMTTAEAATTYTICVGQKKEFNADFGAQVTSIKASNTKVSTTLKSSGYAYAVGKSVGTSTVTYKTRGVLTGKTKTVKVTVKVVNHSYKSATCTKPKTCSRCGATSGKKLGHTFADVSQKNAKCTRCKKVTCYAAGAWVPTDAYVQAKIADLSIEVRKACIEKQHDHTPKDGDLMVYGECVYNGEKVKDLETLALWYAKYHEDYTDEDYEAMSEDGYGNSPSSAEWDPTTCFFLIFSIEEDLGKGLDDPESFAYEYVQSLSKDEASALIKKYYDEEVNTFYSDMEGYAHDTSITAEERICKMITRMKCEKVTTTSKVVSFVDGNLNSPCYGGDIFKNSNGVYTLVDCTCKLSKDDKLFNGYDVSGCEQVSRFAFDYVYGWGENSKSTKSSSYKKLRIGSQLVRGKGNTGYHSVFITSMSSKCYGAVDSNGSVGGKTLLIQIGSGRAISAEKNDIMTNGVRNYRGYSN